MLAPQLVFTWDASKERANVRKHGVHFSSIWSVFNDPLAVNRCDDDHVSHDERWIIVGQTADLMLVVVVYAWEVTDDEKVSIRIISARRATAHERRNYETNPYRVQEPRAHWYMGPEITMKDEYDFSYGERGKFYREGTVFLSSVNVEIAVRVELDALAERMNVDPVTLASDLLKRAMGDLGSRAAGPDQATVR
jgi:uncharacterized protein